MTGMDEKNKTSEAKDGRAESSGKRSPNQRLVSVMANKEDLMALTDYASIRRSRSALITLATLVLGGCATFSDDHGFGTVANTVKERLGQDVQWAKDDSDRKLIAARVNELLGKPLNVDDAVRVALLNNQGLQAALQELKISEADFVQAGFLPNPKFSLTRAKAGGVYTIDEILTFNILSLVTMPYVRDVERLRFVRTQRLVAIEVLELAMATRKAYFTAVAADETARYMLQVRMAAESSADLARRMVQAGNWSKLNQAREQSFYADATQGLARAQLAQSAAREDLTRLMGLWGQQVEYRLPERLPDLPKVVDDLPQIETMAMQSRLDLQVVRAQTEAVARNLGLARVTRFINVLELGPARILEGARSDPYRKGFEVSFEIPIFDWGTARVAKAEATYMQAVSLAAEAAVNARSEVRKSYTTYRTTYDIAKHQRDEVVPIRKFIADENQLRYNGMLISVFDLLADARAQVIGVTVYIDSLRDFWIARADLDSVLVGRISPTLPAPATPPARSGMMSN